MGYNIDITQTRSTASSVASASDEDDLHESGAEAPHENPSSHHHHHHHNATTHTSRSGSSSHPSEPIHLTFPNEHAGQGAQEIHPLDSASRLDRRERPQESRTNALRREAERHRQVPPPHRAPRSRPRPSARPHQDNSPSESEDSTEGFIAGPDHFPMPRPQSYYGPNGYTQSSSSTGSYYPPIPHPTNQMIHYGHPAGQGPMHQHYPHHPPPHHNQYPQQVASPPGGYPPQPGQHPGMGYNHSPHAGSHYAGSPYGPAAIVQHNPYGPPQGYFPGTYGGAPQYPHGYPAPHPYPVHAIPPLPPLLDGYRVATHPGNASAVSSSSSEKPTVDQEEILKKMEALMLAQSEQREAKEKERQASIQSAEDKAKAMREADKQRREETEKIQRDALAMAREQAEHAQRARIAQMAEEARIRKEAKEAAEKTIADAQRAAAEQSAREAKIREEAAKAALEKAAAEAKAKAEQEAREKKIAADAAAAAKSEAEKKAADEAKAAEEAAKTAKEEAEKKVKEAEEAATKAKAEAEAAQAKADAAKPPEKRAPVRFKDAIGRNYNFPWERCNKWRDMEGLIIQAFQHIEDLGEHVMARRYDLIGPDKEIIMPEYWDVTIQPDMHVTMMLWPLPEKPPEPEPEIPPVGGIVDLNDIFGGDKGKKKKKQAKGFSSWMLGGAPKPRKTVKDDKKPGGAQHGDTESNSCTVM